MSHGSQNYSSRNTRGGFYSENPNSGNDKTQDDSQYGYGNTGTLGGQDRSRRQSGRADDTMEDSMKSGSGKYQDMTSEDTSNAYGSGQYGRTGGMHGDQDFESSNQSGRSQGGSHFSSGKSGFGSSGKSGTSGRYGSEY